MTSYPVGKEDGFTLIELVTVIILIAVLSIAALAYFRHSDTTLISQTHAFKTHIRYAQARAMNTNARWGIRYQKSNNEYWLFQEPDTTEKIPLPGQTTNSVRLNSVGLTITGADFSLTFDHWGRPTALGRSFTGRELTLRLNRGGTQGGPITISENTGFIP